MLNNITSNLGSYWIIFALMTDLVFNRYISPPHPPTPYLTLLLATSSPLRCIPFLIIPILVH